MNVVTYVANSTLWWVFFSLLFYREPFPADESAVQLRKIQNGKWAYGSVAEGIKYFKMAKYTEAFQCLNKALTIDAENVEGLVARGAL